MRRHRTLTSCGPLALAAFCGALAVAPAAASAAIAVSPPAGTLDASPTTQISFLGATAQQLGPVSVVGSLTGRHTGRLLAYASATGVSFVPDRGFRRGEVVTVSARPARGTPLRFQFQIGYPVVVQLGASSKPGRSDQVQRFLSRPDLTPPRLAVSTLAPGAAPGDLFLAPLNSPAPAGSQRHAPEVGQPGPMIVDPQGRLVWFDPMPAGQVALGFRAQTLRGAPVLTWWEGQISYLGFGQGVDEVLDGSYRPIATVRAGNGYQADLHEFEITPQGSALVTIFSPIVADLSSIGGSKHGHLTDSVIQQIDIATGLVMFEWHALGNVALSESHHTLPPGSSSPFDAYHVNSIAPTANGSLLLSARNTWALYDLDPVTGRILWRLGGKRSSFAMGRGTSFAWQHDANPRADGTIGIFDNEAAPGEAPQSRAIVVALDQRRRTATLVHQYTHPGKPLLAGSQGSLQTLPNGDAFVGWGAEPFMSEFNQAGHALFDAVLPAGDESYRAYRFPWAGHPADQPAIAAGARSGGGLTVYASWNGATEVAAWRVLAGSSPGSLAQIAVAAPSGFETAIATSSAGPYVAVEALDAAGNLLGRSPTLKA